MGRGLGLDWSGSGYGQITGRRECANEWNLVFQKNVGTFWISWRTLSFSEKYLLIFIDLSVSKYFDFAHRICDYCTVITINTACDMVCWNEGLWLIFNHFWWVINHFKEKCLNQHTLIVTDRYFCCDYQFLYYFMYI